MRNLVFLLFFLNATGFSQTEIPTDYFSSPLDISLFPSGTFGELRNNHFHSGLDIRTQQREGLPVYAAADGYVSRINVQHFGYGKALYILHPNGYSTVYAHLQKYAGEIEKYVKKQQYNKESYEIQLYPEVSVLSVKKGDLIGYSGNTGGSGGPHLHFEIRDGSQRPMNPMLFGYELKDDIPPIINGLYAYPVGDSAHVNNNQNKSKIRLIKVKEGTYTTEHIEAFGKIGFGVSAIDRLNGGTNQNGVYRIISHLNARTSFDVRFDKFSFDETRYINRYIDYEHFKINRDRIQKLFRESSNPLSVIVQDNNDGFLEIQDTLDYSYTIKVMDFKGNETTIIVPVHGKKGEVLMPKNINPGTDLVHSNFATSLTKGKFLVYFPVDALYEDAFLEIIAQGDTIYLHKDEIPLHKSITLTADISQYSEEDRSKLYIGQIRYRGAPRYVPTRRAGEKITATIRNFGNYTIAQDLNPPTVRPINFSEGKWMSNENYLRVRIEDNESGISAYRATINGKFILMEYEYKTKTLTYDFSDNIIQDTENNLKLVVIDNTGNSTTFETKFFRKPN